MSMIRALLHPEYERTCGKCGYAWTVPGYYTKMHARGLPTSFGDSSDGGLVMGSASTGRLDSVQSSNAEMADIVATYKTCAECGSSSHRQKRVWK
jgi:ribosomal protein S27AE